MLCDSIAIPHFAKSSNNRDKSKDRNFDNREILRWNRIDGLPKLKFLEVSNIWNFIYKNQSDIVKNNNFDLIFASDKCDGINKLPYPPLASYICVDDVKSKKGAFDILKSFLDGKNKSTQSLIGEGKINLPNTKINLSFFPNSLIYGSRGSGKSKLCERLKFYFGDDDEKIFFLKQGEYIINKKERIKQKFTEDSICQEYQKNINSKMEKIEKIFCDTLKKINSSLVQSKEKLDEEIKKKRNEIKNNIVENLCDENHIFERTMSKYKNIDQYKNNVVNGERFENIKELINKWLIFLKSFFGKKHEIKSSQQRDIFLNWFKEISKYLISEYEEHLWRKKIEDCKNEIFSQLKQVSRDRTSWEYRFNFSLFDYWLLKQIIAIHKEIICSISPKLKIIKCGEKYGLKFEIDLDEKEYFKVKKIDSNKMELITFKDNGKNFPASFGQVSEFLIKNAINKNKESTVFILDEPEYGLDNNFIKEDLSPFFNKVCDANKYLFLVTHNHVMWSELFENREGNKTYIFCDYDGEHKVVQNTEFNGSIFLDNYEAGLKSYKKRNDLYNNKNNKIDLEK